MEILSRELHSKLLLATLAAARGHEIILSDLEFIHKGLVREKLQPGVYHTKSLTPGKAKIKRHENLINKGTIITSIDEESGIHLKGYNKFVKLRYSEETIHQSSAVFTWGEEDFRSLNKEYKKYSRKIYKTGSPRADLCGPYFKEYWKIKKKINNKPYLLIPSNIAIFGHQSFIDRIFILKNLDYLDRAPEMLKEQLASASNDYLKVNVLVDAIKYLSKHNDGYNIILRPHPNERADIWRILLKGVPNVYINNDGPINNWINNSFAVMQHGCTTALEAHLSQKPLITYVPKELENHHLQNEFANELGFKITSKTQLLKKINFLLKKNKYFKVNGYKISSKISKKIFLDKNQLASEKMINVWEKISVNKNFRPTNLTSLKLFSLKMKFNRIIGNILKRLFPLKYSHLGSSKDNYKFQNIDINEINSKIEKLQKILKIKKKIECKLISKRVILIRQLKI